jgi:hypothetical protein
MGTTRTKERVVAGRGTTLVLATASEASLEEFLAVSEASRYQPELREYFRPPDSRGSRPFAGSSYRRAGMGRRTHAGSASVNGATENARVEHDPAMVFAATVRSLVRAVLRERQ